MIEDAAQDAFWAKVGDQRQGECWLWQGRRTMNNRGMSYGAISIKGREYRAHRLAHFLHTGEWPVVVRHSCDVPLCVNPAHLLGGSQKDNVRDRCDRGRSFIARGERNGRCLLNAETVIQIRRSVKAGCNKSKLARDLGLSRDLIYSALENWRHISEPQEQGEGK